MVPKSWKFYRRLTQITMILIFLLPLLGFLGIKGTLIASNIFGIPLVDPLAGMEIVLASRQIESQVLLGVALVLGAYLVLGKAFCSWVCPVGLLVELVEEIIGGKGKKTAVKTNSQKQCYWMLPAVLITSFLVGIPVFQSFSPLGLFYRALLFGFGLELLLLALILGLELLGVKRGWCRLLCPLGAFYALWGSLSPLGLGIDQDKCTKCQSCARNCNYTKPALSDAINKSLTIMSSNLCTRCGSCIDVCPENAIKFKWQLPALFRKNQKATAIGGEVAATTEIKWEPSRRDLFQLGGAVATVGVMNLTILPAKKASPPLFRPPGAETEEEFLSQCIRCGQCIEVCPEKALLAGDYRHGLSLGTPYFIPRKAPCTMCMDCPEVCPTGALKPLPMEDTRIGVAVIDEERCYAYLDDVCRSCWNNCPLYDEALYMKEFQFPVVVEDKCTGCGLCEYTCVMDEPAIKIIPLQDKLIW